MKKEKSDNQEEQEFDENGMCLWPEGNNDLCDRCQEICKQSSFVKILICKAFNKIPETFENDEI